RPAGGEADDPAPSRSPAGDRGRTGEGRRRNPREGISQRRAGGDPATRRARKRPRGDPRPGARLRGRGARRIDLVSRLRGQGRPPPGDRVRRRARQLDNPNKIRLDLELAVIYTGSSCGCSAPALIMRLPYKRRRIWKISEEFIDRLRSAS